MTLTELKRLAAKMAVAAEKLANVDWDDDYKGVKKTLRSMGLAYDRVGKWTPVIRVRKLNVVFKRRSGLSDGELPSDDYTPWLLKHIIPTADFLLPDGNAWVVQPIALRDASHKWRAFHHFRKCTDKDRLATYDIHSGNVGWYKGKPVLIDW